MINLAQNQLISWDSFNGFVLLDELETEFNVKFSLDEVIDVKNVADIKQHLQTKSWC